MQKNVMVGVLMIAVGFLSPYLYSADAALATRAIPAPLTIPAPLQRQAAHKDLAALAQDTPTTPPALAAATPASEAILQTPVLAVLSKVRGAGADHYNVRIRPLSASERALRTGVIAVAGKKLSRDCQNGQYLFRNDECYFVNDEGKFFEVVRDLESNS